MQEKAIYMSAREAAEEWNISQRRIAVLCSEDRITGAMMIGNMWIIPTDAEKPVDARTLRKSATVTKSKPFIKWAGGKTQLLTVINQKLPSGIGDSIIKYAEPMVGGGAVLFDLIQKYDFKEVFISDVNIEIVNAYRIVRDEVDDLICRLYSIQEDYFELDEDGRKQYYYAKRCIYNELITCGGRGDSVEKAALFMFINKTCFNGLYRVNSKGQYNVPIGSYKKPTICDEDNLRASSHILQGVKIVTGDFSECIDFVDGSTFVYFDPPYRALNKTASFADYSKGGFNDDMQSKLAQFAKELVLKNAKVMLSNSDPKNADENDDFFDDLYSGFNIERVEASRMINSKGASRGKITELLITSYVGEKNEI